MSFTSALHRLATTLAVAGSLVPAGVLTGPPDGQPLGEAGSGVTDGGGTVDPRAQPTGPGGPGDRALGSLRRTWSWPLDPRPAVEAPFVAPRSTWGAGHRGIDLAATQRQSVRAVDAGVVTHVGVIAGRGTVSVTHDSGLRSTYEPVRALVTTGSTVSTGQVLGSVEGRTHCGGDCLHLGALRGSAYVDPRPLLGGGPVILLPLGPDRHGGPGAPDDPG